MVVLQALCIICGEYNDTICVSNKHLDIFHCVREYINENFAGEDATGEEFIHLSMWENGNETGRLNISVLDFPETSVELNDLIEGELQ